MLSYRPTADGQTYKTINIEISISTQCRAPFVFAVICQRAALSFCFTFNIYHRMVFFYIFLFEFRCLKVFRVRRTIFDCKRDGCEFDFRSAQCIYLSLSKSNVEFRLSTRMYRKLSIKGKWCILIMDSLRLFCCIPNTKSINFKTVI